MKIGVFGTFMSPTGTPEMIANFGRRAENAGLESLWMGEHVVLFDEMEFGYPGSRDGRVPVPKGGGILDAVATFGFLASVTSSIRLGTGITLVPQRNPVYTAKEFATLDYLSGGRIDFGVGVGWCKEEVVACGYSWEDRGERCDEFLELMQTLWTQELATYRGKYFTLEECRMDPKPVQQPIPIIVGGHSKRALRRAARFGAGWYGVGLNPEHCEPVLKDLDAALAAQGRARDDFEVIMGPPPRAGADEVRAYEDLGIDRLVMQLGSQRAENVDRRLGELEELVKVVT